MVFLLPHASYKDVYLFIYSFSYTLFCTFWFKQEIFLVSFDIYINMLDFELVYNLQLSMHLIWLGYSLLLGKFVHERQFCGF